MNSPTDISISVTTWPSLNAKQGGTRLDLSLDELIAGLREPAQYKGKWNHPGWSPGVFEPCIRKAVNVKEMFLLGLDYDGDSGATIDEALACWSGVRGFLYTTKSHAPAKHRFRVMLLLNRSVSSIEYKRLWLLADMMLREQGHKVDGQAKDAARFWYAPGTDTGIPHELIDFDGEPLDVDEWLSQAPEVIATISAFDGDEADAAPEIVANAKVYLTAMPIAVSGQGGHPTTFRAAVAMVRGFGLSRKQAHELMMADYNPRCLPPWSSDEVRHKIEDAFSNSTKPWGYLRSRPTIRLGVDLFRVVDDAVAALAQAKTLYQTTGKLVRVVRVEEADESRMSATTGTPLICPLPPSALHEHLTEIARWEAWDNRSQTWVPREPTKNAIQALSDRMEWAGVPPIAGITEVPVMRVDGTVLDKPGYDNATGYLYLSQGHFEPIAEYPSHVDAKSALADLADVFADFPFKTEADRYVPIAALLTLVARPAIVGNVPLIGFDAPLKGTGKTLCIDAVGTIATGRPSYKINWTGAEEEQEKQLNSYARLRAPLVNFDNANTPIRGAALERVLTSRGRVALRVLGSSTIEEHIWKTVIFVSGNQLKIASDMTRRTLRCRMVPRHERPSERPLDAFKHTDLLAWCRQERERLIDSALTLLRAFVVAGKPKQSIGNRGGFEEWIDLIVGAIKWAGGPDILSCWDHEEDDDDGRNAHVALLDWWAERWPEGATSKEALAELQAPSSSLAVMARKAEVLDACKAICGVYDIKNLSARELGFALRALREVYIAGRYFDVGRNTNAGKLWEVRTSLAAE